MNDDADMLSVDELRTLRQEDPRRLFRHLQEVERSFLFGVEDHRDDVEGWGGEVRILLNRNIELHLVPRFNEAMTQVSELPQFTVMSSADRADAVEETEVDLDGDTLRGVIFYVDPQEYDVMLGDALRVRERYDDVDIIPDTYFLDTDLVAFINRVVLEHPTVVVEREFDFRRGLVGGAAPPILDESPAPFEIPDEEDREADEDEDEGEDRDGEHLRTLRL